MNYTFLLGRLAEEPILRTAKNGKEFCRFTLVVDREYSAKAGEKKRGMPKTHDNISCVAWGNQARTIKRYLTKGHLTLVVGKLETWHTQNMRTKEYVKYTTVRVISTQIFDWRRNTALVPKEYKKDNFDVLFDDLNEVYNKKESEKAKSEPDLNIDSDKFAGGTDDPYMPDGFDYDDDYGEIFGDEEGE